MLSGNTITFASDDASSVLEVFEEEGCGVVV